MDTRTVTTVLSGFVYGVAIEKARLVEPNTFRKQMVFENFIYFKTYLTELATTMLVFLVVMSCTEHTFKSAFENTTSGLKTKSKLVSILGATVMGVGMTIAGTCPGSLLGQLGAGVPNSLLTFAGACIGAMIYKFVSPYLPKILLLKQETQAIRLDELMHTQYLYLALPIVAAIGGVVYSLEGVSPWTDEVDQSGAGVLGVRAWPPYVSGTVIGLVQLPLVIVHQNTLGISLIYYLITSGLFCCVPGCSFLDASNIDEMTIRRTFVFCVCAVTGAHISSLHSSSFSSVEGVGPVHAFMGGVLLLFGARLAGGCTHGHGLSSLGFLVTHSLVAVPAMFGGAISTAYVMRRLGVEGF